MTDLSPWYVKAGAGLLGVIVIMILSLTKLIDGPSALAAVTAIVGVFIGATAVLGGAQSIGRALSKLPPSVTALAGELLATPAAAASPVTVNVHAPSGQASGGGTTPPATGASS